MSRLITSNVLSKTVNLGSTAYLASANPVNLVGKSMTVESWVKLPVNDGVDRMVLSIPAAYTTGNCLTFGWRGNRLFFGFYGGDIYSGYTSMDRTLWHHVAASYNYSTKIIKLFINGAKVQESSSTVDLTGIYNAWIGRYYTYYMGGSVCEFRLWDIERTEAEIASNYNKILSPTANTVLNYSFNGVLTDKSVNNNHLSLAAGTTSYVSDAPSAIQIAKLLTSRFNKALNPLSDIEPRKTTYNATTVQDLSVNDKDLALNGGTVHADGYIVPTSTASAFAAIQTPNLTGNNSIEIYLDTGTIGNYGMIMGITNSVGLLNDGFGIRREASGSNFQIWGYGGSSTFTLYINGVAVRRDIAVNSAFGAANGYFKANEKVHLLVVFKNQTGTTNTNMLVGSGGSKVYVARVYNRALTDAEAWGNYINCVGGLPLVSQSKQPYMLNPVAGSGRVSFGTPVHLQNLSSFTVEMLVKPISISSGSTIISKTNNTTNGFKLYGGSVSIAGASGVTTLSNGGYTNGAWAIYAFKYDASIRKLSTFKNLELVAETTLADATWYTPNNDFILHLLAGHTNVGALAALATCDLAYCRIYNRAKTDAEIKADGLKHTINDSSIVLQTIGEMMPDGKIRDLSSYLNHSTPTNISILPSTAPVGQRSGLKFNGTNSTVDTGIGNGFNMNTNPITISCWTAGNTTNETKILFGSAVGTNQRLFVGVIQGKWDIGIQGSSWSGTGAELVAYKQGVMTHIALVLDGFTAKLLVNGVVTRVKSYTSYTLSSNIHIGSIPSSFYWNGVISNVTVYNGAVAESILLEHKHSYLLATTPNLIEQWKLNEGIGTIAYGTKGNNGTITGATWTTPSLMNYVGKQLRLNGTTDYVTVPHNPLLRTFPLTIECIVKTSDMAGGLINLYEANSTNGLLLTLTNTGQPEFYYFGNASNYVYIAPSGAGVADNTHHHIAVTLTASGAKLYVDNTLRSTIAWTGTPMQATSSFPLLLGRYNINSSFYFGGVLDNVRIWNVERTQAELLETMWRDVDRHPNLLFNMGFESGYWDASGYGNHGTAVGSPVIEVTDNEKLLLNAPIN